MNLSYVNTSMYELCWGTVQYGMVPLVILKLWNCYLLNAITCKFHRMYLSNFTVVVVVSSGLSNIIGIIVYISANAGDPSKSDSKKNSYSYGWSFYFGALSFIMAEMVGVLAVHMFIDRHRELRVGARAADYLQGAAITRIPSYRYRYRRRSRSSSRSTDPSHSREASPVGLKAFGTLPSTELSMYTLPKGQTGTPTATYNSTERDHNFLQVHNCVQKDLKDSAANRRTTPVWKWRQSVDSRVE